MNVLTVKNSLKNNILGGKAQIPRNDSTQSQDVFLSIKDNAFVDFILLVSKSSKTFPLVKKKLALIKECPIK